MKSRSPPPQSGKSDRSRQAYRKGDDPRDQHEQRNQVGPFGTRVGGPSFRAVAKQMGLGVVEIASGNPKEVGILANAARILANHGISIRQALVDDPQVNPDPKLTLIGDRVIPGKAIP